MMLVMLLMAQGFSYRLFIRPFIFNFVFISIFLICLFKYQKERRKFYWVMILTSGVIWNNIHLGSFMYGVVLLGSFLLTEILAWLSKRKKMFDYSSVFVFFAFTASLLFNPYGLDGFLHPFKTLFVSDYLQFNVLSQSIRELMPPDYFVSLQNYWYFLFLLAGIYCAFFSPRKNLFCTVIVCFALFFALYAHRGIGFCVIIISYVLVETWPHGKIQWLEKKPYALICHLLILIFCCFQILTLIQTKYFYNNQTNPCFTMTTTVNPQSHSR